MCLWKEFQRGRTAFRLDFRTALAENHVAVFTFDLGLWVDVSPSYVTGWDLGHKCEREIPKLVREDRFQVGFQDRPGQNHLGVFACGVPCGGYFLCQELPGSFQHLLLPE